MSALAKRMVEKASKQAKVIIDADAVLREERRGGFNVLRQPAVVMATDGTFLVSLPLPRGEFDNRHDLTAAEALTAIDEGLDAMILMVGQPEIVVAEYERVRAALA